MQTLSGYLEKLSGEQREEFDKAIILNTAYRRDLDDGGAKGSNTPQIMFERLLQPYLAWYRY